MARAHHIYEYVLTSSPYSCRPLSAAAFREVDIIGVMRFWYVEFDPQMSSGMIKRLFSNTYPDALAMFGANRLAGVEKLVMARFPLEHSVMAFEILMKGVDERRNMVMKAMVGDYDADV
jgi:L-iditol 2-dehydrogenase